MSGSSTVLLACLLVLLAGLTDAWSFGDTGAASSPLMHLISFDPTTTHVRISGYHRNVARDVPWNCSLTDCLRNEFACGECKVTAFTRSYPCKDRTGIDCPAPSHHDSLQFINYADTQECDDIAESVLRQQCPNNALPEAYVETPADQAIATVFADEDVLPKAKAKQTSGPGVHEAVQRSARFSMATILLTSTVVALTILLCCVACNLSRLAHSKTKPDPMFSYTVNLDREVLGVRGDDRHKMYLHQPIQNLNQKEYDTTTNAYDPATCTFTVPENGFYEFNLSAFFEFKRDLNVNDLTIHVTLGLTSGPNTATHDLGSTGATCTVINGSMPFPAHRQVLKLKKGAKVIPAMFAWSPQGPRDTRKISLIQGDYSYPSRFQMRYLGPSKAASDPAATNLNRMVGICMKLAQMTGYMPNM